MKNLVSAARLASAAGAPAGAASSRAGTAPGERSPCIEDSATAPPAMPAALIKPRREGPVSGCSDENGIDLLLGLWASAGLREAGRHADLLCREPQEQPRARIHRRVR